MSSQFNLEDVPVSQRFECSREIASTFYVPVSVSCNAPDSFCFKRNIRLLGDLQIGSGLMTRFNVARTSKHIDRSTADGGLKLIVPMTGAIYIRQDNREALVKPGQFYVSDPTRPYEEEILEDMTYLWAHVPRKAVIERIGKTGSITGTAFGAESPYNELARNFVINLSKVWDAIEGPAVAHMQTILLDLLTAAFWARAQLASSRGIPYPRFRMRSAQFQRAKTFIDQHLGDPHLSLERVAAVIGISVRHVRNLLAEQGLSYRRYVLEQRLARCAADLGKTSLAHRTVFEIACSWGFSDSAHFSRAFRATYGMPPRDYRILKWRCPQGSSIQCNSDSV